MCSYFNFDGGTNNSINLLGVSVGYIKGIEISHSLPLFLEVGSNVTLNRRKFNTTYLEETTFMYTKNIVDAKFIFLNVAVPINVAYKYVVSESFSVQAFAGGVCKFNIVGKEKYDSDIYTQKKYITFDYAILDTSNSNQHTHISAEFDAFGSDSENTMFDKKANRIQLGLNIGCGFNMGPLYLGYAYQPDIVQYAKIDNYKVKTRTNLITLGYTF